MYVTTNAIEDSSDLDPFEDFPRLTIWQRLKNWLFPQKVIMVADEGVNLLLREILAQSQHQSRVLDRICDKLSVKTHQSRSASDELTEVIELLKREPFAALKTWIDQSIEREKMLRKREDQHIHREQSLLERWKEHVKTLIEQRDELMRTGEPSK